MIPKIIHYCWFGHGFMPRKHKIIIDEWKKLMPDYTFMKWDESNFDIHCCEYTERAYKEKKYAYVSDVARCKALTEWGGIYLDTDVKIFKRLDDFLCHSFFSANEIYPEFYEEQAKNNYIDMDSGLPNDSTVGIPYFGVLSSIIGAEPNHPIITEVFEYYMKYNGDFVTIDGLLARMMVKYGYRYKDEKQNLEHNAVIYPTGIFGYEEGINPNYVYSYHLNWGSWGDKSKDERLQLFMERYYLSGIYKIYKFSKSLLKQIVRRKK